MRNTNQRFAVSVHILTLLAASQDAPLTSEAIAASVDTNPVVIRRTMAHLRQHGLVDSRPGANGGWKLMRPASQISLCEVFRAVSHDEVLSTHSHPDPDCLVGGMIQETLGHIFEKAQNAMEAALGQFTVSDVLRDVLARQGSQ